MSWLCMLQVKLKRTIKSQACEYLKSYNGLVCECHLSYGPFFLLYPILLRQCTCKIHLKLYRKIFRIFVHLTKQIMHRLSSENAVPLRPFDPKLQTFRDHTFLCNSYSSQPLSTSDGNYRLLKGPFMVTKEIL